MARDIEDIKLPITLCSERLDKSLFDEVLLHRGFSEYYGKLRKAGTRTFVQEVVASMGRTRPGENKWERSREDIKHELVDEWNEQRRREEGCDCARVSGSPQGERRHPTQLDRILKDLVAVGIMKRTTRKVVKKRSSPDKRKKNTFYALDIRNIIADRLKLVRAPEEASVLSPGLEMLMARFMLRQLAQLKTVRELLEEYYGTDDPLVAIELNSRARETVLAESLLSEVDEWTDRWNARFGARKRKQGRKGSRAGSHTLLNS
jgi:hypothetical protein